MGRRYVLSGENFTLGTGSILAAIATTATGAGSVLEVERVEATQNHNSTPAQVRLFMGQRDSAGTLTVTPTVPRPIIIGGPASAIASGTNALFAGNCGINSSADSGGTYTQGPYCNPNNMGGYLFQPIPQHVITLPPSKIWTVGFMTAPSDPSGWTVNVWFHEYI